MSVRSCGLKKWFSRFVVVFVATVLMILPNNVSAVGLPDSIRSFFALNDIIFYCSGSGGGSISMGTGAAVDSEWDGECTAISGSSAEWIQNYISVIMEVAEEYGLPWELIPAQSFAESGGGRHEACDYNTLGIKANGAQISSGQYCTVQLSSGNSANFAKFSSHEEAFRHYANIASIEQVQGLYPEDPYSAIAYIQSGAAQYHFAVCDDDVKYPQCVGHLGEPTPGYVQNVSKFICGIQKWALENGYEISDVTWENFGSSGASDGGVTTAVSSDAQWQDGWLVEGSIPGAIKEDAANVEINDTPKESFSTNGPNKILLHSTEGNANGMSAYQVGKRFPAHFTIDLLEKKLSQHFPIDKPSVAISNHDDMAGIQIEIVGFSDTTSQKNSGRNSEKFLPKYGDDEWDYLAMLLIAISAETGIPLSSSVEWTHDGSTRITSVEDFKNYTGILGHQHATDNDHIDPGPIWDQVAAAIARNPNSVNMTASSGTGSSGGICGTKSQKGSAAPTGSSSKLVQLLKEWVWPEYKKDFTERMPAYAEYIDNEATYKGACDGVDCGAFVANIIKASGWDSNYIQSSSTNQNDYLKSNWERVTDTSSLQLGDVGYHTTPHSHVVLYIGEIDGLDGVIASASQCDRAPMVSHDDVSDYTWYRRK